MFIYLLAHLCFVLFVDVPWMPPPPPSNPEPTSLKKKNPDGPLILRDDFLSDFKNLGTNTIVVFADSADHSAVVKSVDRTKLKKIQIPESFIKVSNGNFKINTFWVK